jgi:hypothetical protein
MSSGRRELANGQGGLFQAKEASFSAALLHEPLEN